MQSSLCIVVIFHIDRLKIKKKLNEPLQFCCHKSPPELID